ncbi:MAG: tetratricopeptide repeat protein [Aquificae bacterium]|nr:tetratricopeptide repeat protein [Aquificota bacterium]
MSMLIQALENLEKQNKKYTSNPNVDFFLISKQKKNSKEKRKILVLLSITSLITGIAVATINIYSYQHTRTIDFPKSPPQKVSPPQKSMPPVQQTNIIDIPVPASYPIEELSITEKEFIPLNQIKITFPNHPIPVEKHNLQENTQKDIDSTFLSLVWLAEESYNQKNIEGSLRYYQQAYNLKKDEDILQNIILILIDLNKSNLALEKIKDISSLERVYEVILYAIENNHIELAKKMLLRYIPFDTNGDFFYLAGYLYELSQNYQKALEYYRKAYFKNQKDQYFMYAYARILEINNEYTQAEKIFRELKSIENLDPNIKHIISRL